MKPNYELIPAKGKYNFIFNNGEIEFTQVDRVWTVTADLVGIREDDCWFIFSLKEGKTVSPPFLSAVIPLFTRIEENKKDRPVSFYMSEQGMFHNSFIYIEEIMEHLWGEEGLLVLGDLGLVQVSREGQVGFYEGDDYDVKENQAMELCWVVQADGSGKPDAIYNFCFTIYDPDPEESFKFLDTVSRKAPTFDQVLSAWDLVSKDRKEGSWPVKPYIPFDFNALPAAIQRACLQHLDKFYVVKQTHPESIQNLVKLAWLYANGYMACFSDGMHLSDPRYDFDPLVLFDDTNLNLFDSYELGKLVPLLRTYDSTNSYLDGLGQVN